MKQLLLELIACLQHEKSNQLKVEIQLMLQKCVIEESDIPWVSPVIMVPKKDGKIGVYIDYWQLNSITLADHYPLPRIDDLIQSAKFCTPFTST